MKVQWLILKKCGHEKSEVSYTNFENSLNNYITEHKNLAETIIEYNKTCQYAMDPNSEEDNSLYVKEIMAKYNLELKLPLIDEKNIEYSNLIYSKSLCSFISRKLLMDKVQLSNNDLIQLVPILINIMNIQNNTENKEVLEISAYEIFCSNDEIGRAHV